MESPREIMTLQEVLTTTAVKVLYRVGRWYHLHDGDRGPYNMILLLLCTFMCVQVALWTIIARVII